MNTFDIGIIRWMNQWAQISWLFDKSAFFIANNNLIKGGVVISIYMFWWFGSAKTNERLKEHVFGTLITVIPAVFIARVLAILVPMRLRPMHNADLNFILPTGSDRLLLDGMSSFPSDHAALYVTLLVGFYFLSRRLGGWMTVYTLFVILLPRIYLGYHYPTDMIAGALLGLCFGLIGNSRYIMAKLIKSPTSSITAKL